MPTPIKNTDSKRNLFIAGGFVLFGAVGFAIGYSASSLQEPIIQPKAATTSASSADSLGGGSESRAGSISVSDAPPKSGTAPTVGEITGGQPLEPWLKRLMAQEDELFRMQNFMKLLESLNTPEDIEAALKVIMENGNGGRGRGPGGGRFTELSMLMAKYVQLDPKAAMSYSSKLEGGEKFMATSSALRTWTRLSPEAALAWAKTEGANITMDFGRGGPGGGGEQDGPKDNFALLNVVSQLAKSDLDKALTTASAMELGRFGDRMVDTLANEMISQRGVDASKAYLDSLPVGAFRDQFLQQIADPLAKKDPQGTAKWLASLPVGENTDATRRALGTTLDNWVRNDYAGAASYMSGQPVSPVWDSARSELIRANKDPLAAWQQLPTISDPKRQMDLAGNIGQKLIAADPTNGPAIIANSNYPDDVKARASQPQQQGNRGGFNGGRRGGN